MILTTILPQPIHANRLPHREGDTLAWSFDHAYTSLLAAHLGGMSWAFAPT